MDRDTLWVGEWVVEFYIVERDDSSLPSSSLTMRFVKNG